jgi:MoaA/NifB/PqqE/SkfB family radical SAM enzyme
MKGAPGTIPIGEISCGADVPILPASGVGPSKIYVEATTRCNLDCQFCVRRAWDESLGDMDGQTFAAILEGVHVLSRRPTVMFGGIGEPLAHARLPEMVAQAKSLGARVELVTNGTLLSRAMGRALIEAGLDLLWVSIDGATPERYGDLRLGAAMHDVLGNLALFCEGRRAGGRGPETGIAFVAMRRNIADLPALRDLAGHLGVAHFHVSHLLAHTPEMLEETLYPQVPSTRPPQIGGRCPFIESGAVAIGWDGSVSPCVPLLHGSRSFLNGGERFTQRWSVGRVTDRNLLELWNAQKFQEFRQRVKAFSFAPCASCGGCGLVHGNEEDCYGNPLPTCGGCLWSKGLISCP